MNPYTLFPEVYDHLFRNVDYEYWYRYIRSIMLQYVENPVVILELGCGTGKFGAKFSRDGYICYGMDKSIDMLKIAKIRAFKNYRIFCADMTNFSLVKKFDFLFSVHDTMNYLLDYDNIRKTFSSINRTMNDNSIFMFDITTEHNIYKNFTGEPVLYNVNNMNIKWSNEYDSKRKLIFSILEFRKKNGEIETETHIQRIYTINELTKILIEENFDVIDIYSDYSFESPHEDSVMINFITRKSKSGKTYFSLSSASSLISI